MKPLGRFVIRPEDKAGLILGMLFPTPDSRVLKPNTIYQITDILNELVIVERGSAAIKMSLKDSLVSTCWGHDVNSIVQNGSHLYTETEAKIIKEINKQHL